METRQERSSQGFCNSVRATRSLTGAIAVLAGRAPLGCSQVTFLSHFAPRLLPFLPCLQCTVVALVATALSGLPQILVALPRQNPSLASANLVAPTDKSLLLLWTNLDPAEDTFLPTARACLILLIDSRKFCRIGNYLINSGDTVSYYICR